MAATASWSSLTRRHSSSTRWVPTRTSTWGWSRSSPGFASAGCHPQDVGTAAGSTPGFEMHLEWQMDAAHRSPLRHRALLHHEDRGRRLHRQQAHHLSRTWHPPVVARRPFRLPGHDDHRTPALDAVGVEGRGRSRGRSPAPIFPRGPLRLGSAPSRRPGRGQSLPSPAVLTAGSGSVPLGGDRRRARFADCAPPSHPGQLVLRVLMAWVRLFDAHCLYLGAHPRRRCWVVARGSSAPSTARRFDGERAGWSRRPPRRRAAAGLARTWDVC